MDGTDPKRLRKTAAQIARVFGHFAVASLLEEVPAVGRDPVCTADGREAVDSRILLSSVAMSEQSARH